MIPPHDTPGPVAAPAAAGPKVRSFTMVDHSAANFNVSTDVQTPGTGIVATGDTGLSLGATGAEFTSGVTITVNGTPMQLFASQADWTGAGSPELSCAWLSNVTMNVFGTNAEGFAFLAGDIVQVTTPYSL